MVINVTEEDKKLESLVMERAVELLENFKHLDWRHNTENDVEVFDFDGFYLGVQRIRADVKVLYCDQSDYSSNIMSIEKYEDYVENGSRYDYYLLYYYPKNKLCRVYDLNKSDMAIRDIKIFHKREKIYKDCTVIFITSADKIELKEFIINETNRENREEKPTSEPDTETTVFDEEYIEM